MSQEQQQQNEEQPRRALLPTCVRPKHYQVSLTPNLTDFTFKGEEKIEVEVKENTKQVVLHSNKLQITEAWIETAGERITISQTKLDQPSETLTLELTQELTIGSAVVGISFNGVLNDQMVGFYRSSYTFEGEKRWLATTQFEPTDARMAFPCWDEPAIKATFEISLTIPANLIALSNMPVISQSPVTSENTKTVTFDKTPIMSTYLVAFCVGEFDFVESQTPEGVVIRTYTQPGKSHTGQFALDVAVKTLSYFTQYFEIAYPLPKLDMVAIPDFSAGAMENWGLVTYRETALLIDPKSSGVANKQRVAYVVAHELAHQWFGNLVTMEWWKELWLNEGFATFIGNQAVNEFFPEWQIWTKFVSDYFAVAMKLDGLVNSHPIEVEVWNSSQINEIFDSISYCKGASIIRQVATYLGEEAFKKGLNIYLNRHKYSNAVTQDLWKALSESSGRNVSEFMDRWTKVSGYPVISVRSTEQPNVFEVEQQRFLSSGAPIDSEAWWISLSAISSKHSNVKEAQFIDFREKNQTIQLNASIVEGCDWLKFNAEQSGFYRVNYDLSLANRLTLAIQSKQLGAVDRLGVESDAFALARAGKQQTSLALLLAQSFDNETDYTVWSDLSGGLGGVSKMLEGSELSGKFDSFACKLLRRQYERLGWEKKDGEADLDTLLRALVINQLGDYNDIEVIKEAKIRFDKYTSGDVNAIAADYRSTVFSLAVKHGDLKEYEAALNVYRTASMHDERLRALRALGSTKNGDLLKRSLEFAIGDEVKSQDIFYLTSSLSANPIGREVTWRFVQDHWSVFENKFKDSLMTFSTVIGSVIGHFTTIDKVDEIERFFEAHPIECAARTIKQTIEVLKTRIAWFERDKQDLQRFFDSLN